MNYPFNSVSDNYNDPYIDQVFHHKPIPNNPSPNAFSFSHFPSSIFLCSEVDDVFFRDPFSQQQQPFLETSYFVPEVNTVADHNMIAPPKNNIDDGGASSSSASGESKGNAFQVGKVELADKGLKKRATTTTSKRDRHSKINTAQGPRDRRMRLSLDIARRFFGLQDILGFDKASKTVEWLLNKSKSDIQKLSKVKQIDDPSPPSPSSECEVVSGLDDDVSLKYEDQLGIMGSSISNKKPSPDNKLKEKKIRRSISSSQRDISGAKESRAKARERARERTKDKMRSRSLYESLPNSNTNQELSKTQMGSCCWRVPFSSLSLDSMNPSSSLDAFEVNDRLIQFNYPHSNWGNFQENPCGDFAFHHKL